MGQVSVTVTKDGPYRVDGAVALSDATGADVSRTGPVFLCRCGQSRSKPFCDGSHKRVGFDGTEAASRDAPQPAAAADEDPSIAAGRNGPYRLRGEVEVIGADGARYERRGVQLLCRCGQSRSKPFCDGSHRDAGFADPA